MKNRLCTGLVFLLAMMLTGCMSAADKEAIEKQIKTQVDEVVTAIDGGKKAEDFKKLATEPKYYVFIMDQSGKLLVHPFMESISQSDGAYFQIMKATAEGIWVEFVGPGHVWKRCYVKKTKGGLIVASGYD
jgi:hypothetical protein